MRDIQITIYPKVYGKHEPTYITLGTALERIKKGGNNRFTIKALREGDTQQE